MIVKVKNEETSIRNNRKKIGDALMRKSYNIKSERILKISGIDLELLFQYYEELFLDHWFQKNFKGKLEFSLSKRMTKSAGITKCPKNIMNLKPEEVSVEICIGVDFFFQYDLLTGTKKVCGIETHNSLEALQVVFEHEICHAMEFIKYGNSNCKGKIFKETAQNLFGHKESYHEIPTHQEIVREKFGIHVGNEVSFLYEGNKMMGWVAKIHKRATVMVNHGDGNFIDEKGVRYMKYYVSVANLERVN
jgi:hypothetical protein